MSAVEVVPDSLIEKDTNESRTIEWNWDRNSLATSVTISASTWTITVIRPSTETPAGLTKDSESILSGTRKTQVRLIGGTLGSLYQVTNKITTNESPAQIKERSLFIQVRDQ
jgi:hypothetical protein